MFQVFPNSEFSLSKLSFFWIILNQWGPAPLFLQVFLPLSHLGQIHPLLCSHKMSRRPHSFPGKTTCLALGCKCDRAAFLPRDWAQFPVRFVPIKDHPSKPLQENHRLPVSRNDGISVTHSKRTLHQGVGQAAFYWIMAQHSELTLWRRAGKEFGDTFKKRSHFRSPATPGMRVLNCTFEEGMLSTQIHQDIRSTSGIHFYGVIRENA